MNKKLILFPAICFVAAVGCHKKTIPVITARTEFPEAPAKVMSKIAENSPEAIAAGKTIYLSKCNRCHDLKEPNQFTPQRWTSILQIMIPRARLSEDQAKQVTAFILANATE